MEPPNNQHVSFLCIINVKSRYDKNQKLRASVKINLSTEDAFGGNAKNSICLPGRKKKIIMLSHYSGHPGSLVAEDLYLDSSGYKVPQKEGHYHSVEHHCHPLFHRYVHVDHVQHRHSL